MCGLYRTRARLAQSRKQKRPTPPRTFNVPKRANVGEIREIYDIGDGIRISKLNVFNSRKKFNSRRLHHIVFNDLRTFHSLRCAKTCQAC